MNYLIKLIALLILTMTFSMNDGYSQRNKKAKISTKSTAQPDTLLQPIPINRQLFTDKIDAALKNFDLRDGRQDNHIKFRDDASALIVTKAILEDVPKIVIMVENADLPSTNKIAYHRATAEVLEDAYNKNWSATQPVYFKELTNTLRGLIEADMDTTLLDYAKQHTNLMTLNLMEKFYSPEAKAYLYENLSDEYPEMFISQLNKFKNEPYADKIVAAAAKVNPGKVLTYAKSTSDLSRVVRRNQDPLVQTIVSIADNSKNSIKMLPFVGAIHSGKKSITDLNKILDNEKQYLQALVDLVVDNEQLGRTAIDQEISIRVINYIRKINALHNASNSVRFASIQGFRDVDYYAMMIGGQDEIYTSSFVSGTYPLMLAKMKPETGKQFLEKVNYWHFRTFLRMAAGYNVLSEFLKTYEKQDEKKDLMKKFVSDLEKGGPNDLEEAVNVADAYGSIKDTAISNFLKEEIVSNYERNKRTNNKKGIVVYGLLGTIFSSAENSDSLSDKLSNIPPITYLPYSQLTNDSGEVIEQVFFYGDSDGKTAYNNFVWKVKAAGFTTTENKNWITFTNKKNPKYIIYANKPLPEPADEEAQKELSKYMNENNITPTVIIHRGHSYYVNTTLANLNPDVKLVMLGSCGGYHNLANVLDNAPDAHIISTKQTGTLAVNMEIIEDLHKYIEKKEDINWVKMWKDLDALFSKRSASDKAYYQDYISPDKNLGAIFIKAYRNLYDSI